QLIEQVVQALEVGLPEFAVAFEPFVGLRERLGFDAAGPPLGVAAARNQARAFQHLEVLGDGGLAHGERLRQFHDRDFAGGKTGENRPPGGIGERGEDGVESRGRLHGIPDGYVTYWLYTPGKERRQGS